MCKTHNPSKIDKCLKILIENLNEYFGDDLVILACCCGHGKYDLSIIIKEYPSGRIYDYCSNTDIPNRKRFYVKDKQGFYYIPETVLPTKHNSKKACLFCKGNPVRIISQEGHDLGTTKCPKCSPS